MLCFALAQNPIEMAAGMAMLIISQVSLVIIARVQITDFQEDTRASPENGR